MAITFRNYSNLSGITDDYYKVRSFLVNLGYDVFEYTRWDWMITHPMLDESALGKIGLWESDGEIIGIATFDTRLGAVYCMTYSEFEHLKADMMCYAKEHLSESDNYTVVIPDYDIRFQHDAYLLGLLPSQNKESDSIFFTETMRMDYKLPTGFKITSIKDTYDLYQYKRVLWRGFNHELKGEGELDYSHKVERAAIRELNRPNVDLNLKIAAVSSEGNFVSYCGMWYEPNAGFAVVEPVVTDPAYRKLGLGKAVVLEGIQRVAKLGAKKVIVGSSQQFYYNIGFRPCSTFTHWVMSHK